jgi:hypothetical protein
MVFTLPPLANDVNIVGRTGVASRYFSALWAKLTGEIVSQEAKQDTLLVQVLAAQSAAAMAQSSAAAAQGQAQTANATANSAAANFPAASSAWVVVSTIDLPGITAGTLRFDTTSIYERSIPVVSGVLSGTTFSGLFRIREQTTGGGSPATLVSGTWSAIRETDPFVFIITNVDDVAALNAARPAVGLTGTVRYTFEVSRASGSTTVTNIGADFRAAKAS